jgi:ATP-dependent helicase/nuclease subunit B
VREGVASVLELIDYKTGNADALRQKLKQPLEDTQLAFYAALMRGQGEAPLRAIYLPLDGTKALVPLLHPDVDRSAQALVDGLGADFARMRAGAGLPALGEGRTCEHCDARGLCRRDHWSEEQGA